MEIRAHDWTPGPSIEWSLLNSCGKGGCVANRSGFPEVVRLSRRGDCHLRGLLYEAAAVILTRSSIHSTLRTWGLQLRKRIGFKRAAVAVARKLAVIMHTMLKTGELFNPNAGAAA